MATLALDPDTWDLVVRNGRFVYLTGDEAIAQSVACQLKLFLGELYYDTEQGVPYWQQIIGFLPSPALMKAKFEQAALLVKGVLTATAFINSVSNREVLGVVEVTTTSGQTIPVAFNF